MSLKVNLIPTTEYTEVSTPAIALIHSDSLRLIRKNIYQCNFTDGTLANIASCYAAATDEKTRLELSSKLVTKDCDRCFQVQTHSGQVVIDRIMDLARAGALICCEIERLQGVYLSSNDKDNG
jgi:hypothetical protein